MPSQKSADLQPPANGARRSAKYLSCLRSLRDQLCKEDEENEENVDFDSRARAEMAVTVANADAEHAGDRDARRRATMVPSSHDGPGESRPPGQAAPAWQRSPS
jgi:hypothetical protein